MDNLIISDFSDNGSELQDIGSGSGDPAPTPLVTGSPDQLEQYVLSVGDYNQIAISSFPLGALSGAIFMIIGFAVLGIVWIFKKL